MHIVCHPGTLAQPTLIGKGDGGYLPAGWRGGLHSQFLYPWRIKQTGHVHDTLAAKWKKFGELFNVK